MCVFKYILIMVLYVGNAVSVYVIDAEIGKASSIAFIVELC